MIEGKKAFTLIIDDPVGNSYIQNLNAPADDPKLTAEEYERTWEQNENLGLNDMKTENYLEEESKEKEKEKETKAIQAKDKDEHEDEKAKS